MLHGDTLHTPGVSSSASPPPGAVGGFAAADAEAASFGTSFGASFGASFGIPALAADGQRIERGAFKTLVAAEGERRAASIKALSLFLAWGSMCGNTVNNAKKGLVGLRMVERDGLALFDVLFFLYYAPLMFLVFLVFVAATTFVISSRRWTGRTCRSTTGQPFQLMNMRFSACFTDHFSEGIHLTGRVPGRRRR